MSLPVALLIALLASFAGALLIAFGMRGRRIDDHPTCARCRFDLSGATAETLRCPECGAVLVGEASLVIGRRRRSPGMIGTGAMLLIAASPMFILLAWAGATGFDWNTIKPVGWLVRDAAGPDPSAAPAARRELDRRLANAKLSGRELRVVTDRALRIQREADPGAWSPWWAQFIESASLLGVLPGQVWHEYASHFAPLRVEYDIAYAQGDSIGFDLVADEARIAPNDQWWVFARLSRFRILNMDEMDPGDVPLASMGQRIIPSRTDLRYRWSFSVDPDLEPGLYRAELTWTIRVSEPDAGRAWTADRVHDAAIFESEGREVTRSFADYASAEWQRTEIIPIVILPKEFRGPVGFSTGVTRARADASLRDVYVTANPVPHSSAVYVKGEFSDPACDMVFDVYLETMSGEPPLGNRWFVRHVEARAGESSRFVASAYLEDEFDAQYVDIVFRPCWKDAAMRAGVSNIWSEVLVRRRERVRWYGD